MSQQQQQEDATFLRLFTLMCVALTVFCIAMIILARIIESNNENVSVSDETIESIAPVGSVNTGDPIEPEPAEEAVADAAADATTGGAKSGKEVYDSACFICHATPAVGAPVLGSASDWEPRIAQGMDVLHDHAINGYQGEKGLMPAKGGRVDLSDDEVKAAVDYMVESAGGSAGGSDEPQADAAAQESPAEEAMSEEAAADEGTLAEGKEIYDTACFICHASGAAGAPKFGDAENWAPRIAQGKDVLYDHAIKGYMGANGLMPPKGGRADISDDKVRAAVDYMVSTAQ